MEYITPVRAVENNISIAPRLLSVVSATYKEKVSAGDIDVKKINTELDNIFQL
jgi:hypothetical protein